MLKTRVKAGFSWTKTSAPSWVLALPSKISKRNCKNVADSTDFQILPRGSGLIVTRQMRGISVPEWGRKRVASRFTYKKKKKITPKRDRHLWSKDQILAASVPTKNQRLRTDIPVSAPAKKKKKKTKWQNEKTDALQIRNAVPVKVTQTPTRNEETRVAKRMSTTKPRSSKVPPRAPRKRKHRPQFTKAVRLKAQREGEEERGHQSHGKPQDSHQQKLESKIQSLTSALISTVAHHRKKMLELGQASTEQLEAIQAETDGVAAQLSADLASIRSCCTSCS